MEIAVPPRMLLLAVAALLATAAWAPGAQAQSSPGDVELFNLEHVFNFNPENHDPGRDANVGSDLEFFTSTVPLRDYETGQLVDADGKPLRGNADPVTGERDFAVMGSYQRGGYVFDVTDPENPEFVSQVTCRQSRNDVAIKRFTDPDTGETRVLLALTQQSGTPCSAGAGVKVNSPAELQGFHDAVHWSGSGDATGQTGELAYARCGSTPASYAGVDVAGKIALVDRARTDDAAPDPCPPATFFQKAQSAQAAGAIGLVQVPGPDQVPTANPTAITADIPAMEVFRNDDTVAMRDAVVTGQKVEVTLGPPETEIPAIGEGSGGVGVFDITDPLHWKPMYLLRTGNGGVHNFIFHPTKPFGYASNGALPGGLNQIPIVDFTDVDSPVVIADGRAPTEGGVHDIEFSPDGDRAYAASENNYRIYDTTDPANPELLSRTPNVGTYAHGVFPSPDLELMVTNNESLALGGFFADATGVCPGEGLAAYDITNERAPIGPLGYYVPDVVGRTTDHRACTSHFGRFAPGTKILSMGWYIAGTRVVDWSNPSNPVEVAGAVLDGTETWAAKFHKGPYVYAGDLGRGFDVFRWTGDGPAPWLADTGEAITLSAAGRRERGQHTVDLTWDGARSGEVDVYRDGEVVATVPNSGSHTDETGNRGTGSYAYRVCEPGAERCSNETTVTFAGG